MVSPRDVAGKAEEEASLASTIDWHMASTTGIADLKLGRAKVLSGLGNFLNKDRPDHCNTEHLKEKRSGDQRWMTVHPLRSGTIPGQPDQQWFCCEGHLGRLLRDKATSLHQQWFCCETGQPLCTNSGSVVRQGNLSAPTAVLLRDRETSLHQQWFCCETGQPLCTNSGSVVRQGNLSAPTVVLLRDKATSLHHQ